MKLRKRKKETSLRTASKPAVATNWSTGVPPRRATEVALSCVVAASFATSWFGGGDKRKEKETEGRGNGSRRKHPGF